MLGDGSAGRAPISSAQTHLSPGQSVDTLPPTGHFHCSSAFCRLPGPSKAAGLGVLSCTVLPEAWTVPAQGGWQNRILARLSNEMSRYNPIHYVPQVKAPVLMVATTRDAMCSIHLARRAATLNPMVKLVEKEAGKHLSNHHFQPYGMIDLQAAQSRTGSAGAVLLK